MPIFDMWHVLSSKGQKIMGAALLVGLLLLLQGYLSDRSGNVVFSDQSHVGGDFSVRADYLFQVSKVSVTMMFVL